MELKPYMTSLLVRIYIRAAFTHIVMLLFFNTDIQAMVVEEVFFLLFTPLLDTNSPWHLDERAPFNICLYPLNCICVIISNI